MAPFDSASRIDCSLGGGKDVLPNPMFVGIRQLAFQGVRQSNAAKSFLQVLLMQELHSQQVLSQWFLQSRRQWRHPILGSLAVPDPNLVVREIDVFDSQAQALHPP